MKGQAQSGRELTVALCQSELYIALAYPPRARSPASVAADDAWKLVAVALFETWMPARCAGSDDRARGE
jgi:hypothetical protein